MRAPEDVHERLERAALSQGVTKSELVLTILGWGLDALAAKPHTPAVVAASMPRRVGARMVLPTGRHLPGT